MQSYLDAIIRTCVQQKLSQYISYVYVYVYVCRDT